MNSLSQPTKKHSCDSYFRSDVYLAFDLFPILEKPKPSSTLLLIGRSWINADFVRSR